MSFPKHITGDIQTIGFKKYWLKWAFSSLLVLVLWPALFYTPWNPGISLDASWQQVLMYAQPRGWQFGRDVVFTWGPWGFLNSEYHSGHTGAIAKILWETVGKLAISVGIVMLTEGVSVVRRILFIFSCAILNCLFLDTIFLVFIALIVLVGLMRKEISYWHMATYILALAFLSQIKFTYTLFAFAGVCASAASFGFRRRYITGLAVVIAFAVSYVVFWLAAGQRLGNLCSYVRWSLEISSGYVSAMGVDEPRSVFISGVVLACICLLFTIRLALCRQDFAFSFPAAGFLLFAWFLTWKHGFVRADGHVMAFFIFSGLMAIVLGRLCFPKTRWQLFDLASVMAIIGLYVFDSGLLARCPGIAWAGWQRSVTSLTHVSNMPTIWEEARTQTPPVISMPLAKQAIGACTVDVFNFQQGVALQNGLNYTPRPIFQSYSAYTSRLNALNFRFYQSSRAPDYILWKQQTIDERYPTTDDALLVSELPHAYRPVLEEGGFLLLKKRSTVSIQRQERKIMLKRALELDEVLNLPTSDDTPIWFQATLNLNLFGKVRAFFYKPPTIHMVVVDETGRETSWRLLPRVADEGFLLTPLLETQTDFAAYCGGRGQHWIRSLRITVTSNQAKFWMKGKCAEVRLFTLPRLKSDR